ncbi:MAG: pyruvate kinase [Myxococcota bacterium]
MDTAQRALVTTLGPASLHLASEIAQAGATAFRLNASHMTVKDLVAALRSLQQASLHIPVVADLQGAKMRLGTFEPLPLQPGSSLKLTLAPGIHTIPLPHPELFQAVRKGDTLSCDDDRVRLGIEHVGATSIRARSLVAGVLRPRKGVNVLEHPVDLTDLTKQDIAQLEAAANHPDVSFACSFMRDGRESSWIRSRQPSAKVIGKVERAEAIAAMDSIARQVDEIWICRGDLGAQLGLPELARWLADFDPRRFGIPVFIAGQVLEHLTHHADPTRSEVCHLYDLLRRGFDGVVLSDETAVGADPVRAAATARRLMDALCTPGA